MFLQRSCVCYLFRNILLKLCPSRVRVVLVLFHNVRFGFRSDPRFLLCWEFDEHAQLCLLSRGISGRKKFLHFHFWFLWNQVQDCLLWNIRYWGWNRDDKSFHMKECSLDVKYDNVTGLCLISYSNPLQKLAHLIHALISYTPSRNTCCYSFIGDKLELDGLV